MDDFAKGRYDMILGRDLLTTLGSTLKISDHVIEANHGPLKGLHNPWLIWLHMSLKI